MEEKGEKGKVAQYWIIFCKKQKSNEVGASKERQSGKFRASVPPWNPIHLAKKQMLRLTCAEWKNSRCWHLAL